MNKKKNKKIFVKITQRYLKEIINLIPTKSFEFDNLGKLNSKNGKKIISYIEDDKLIPNLLDNKSIICVFTTKDLQKKLPKIVIIKSRYPKYDFCRLHNYLFTNTNFYKNKIPWKGHISSKTIIKSNGVSKDTVYIGSNTVIENNSVIKSRVKIGKNVQISSNVVIAEDGIEIAKKKNSILKFLLDGGVVVGNNVQILSHVSIKRGFFGNHTIIGNDTTLNSFVNIGHGTKIGKNCYLTPGTIIAGSCVIGNNCYFGINSSVKNGIKIGENCKIGAGSVVTRNIPANKVVVGIPAKIIEKNN